jgi:hypothetical protein
LAACFGAGCAIGAGDEAASLAPVGAVDPAHPGGDPSESGGGAGSSGTRSDASAGPNSDASTRDANAVVRDAAGRPDAAAEASGANACGICDRTWVCNNFAAYWASESDGRCVNQANRTGLRCNGVLDGPTARNVGTWSGNAASLTLNFQSLNGGTHVITCAP